MEMDTQDKLDEVMSQIRKIDHDYANQLKVAGIGDRSTILQKWLDDPLLHTLSDEADKYLAEIGFGDMGRGR